MHASEAEHISRRAPVDGRDLDASAFDYPQHLSRGPGSLISASRSADRALEDFMHIALDVFH
jgi:hypothetical protein